MYSLSALAYIEFNHKKSLMLRIRKYMRLWFDYQRFIALLRNPGLSEPGYKKKASQKRS